MNNQAEINQISKVQPRLLKLKVNLIMQTKHVMPPSFRPQVSPWLRHQRHKIHQRGIMLSIKCAKERQIMTTTNVFCAINIEKHRWQIISSCCPFLVLCIGSSANSKDQRAQQHEHRFITIICQFCIIILWVIAILMSLLCGKTYQKDLYYR